MRETQQITKTLGNTRLWIGLGLLVPALSWGQPAGAPHSPGFWLNPPPRAPANVVAADAAGPGGAPEAAADPRAAQMTRWLREQLTSRASTPAHAPPQVEAERIAAQQAALARLQAENGGDVQVRLRPSNGTPLFIKGPRLGHRFSGIAKAGIGSDELTARQFLRTNRALLRLEDPDQELVLVERQADELGYRHLRFEQQFNGLPVWPCRLSVHLNAAGDVYLLDGAFSPTPAEVVTTPSLSAAQAVTAARDHLQAEATAEATDPLLVIYAPVDQPARLAWKLELTLRLGQAWRCLIDAGSGALLAQFDLCPHSAVNGSGVDDLGVRRPLALWEADGVYYMVDTSKPMFDPSSPAPKRARRHRHPGC